MPSKAYVSQNDPLRNSLEENIYIFTHNKSTEISRKSFHPDELTECGRRIILRANNIHSLPKNNAENYNDKFIKSKWINILQNVHGIKVLDRCVEVADCNYNIQSCVDCVIEISGWDNLHAIIYIRSLPSEKFNSDYVYTRKDIIRVMTDMWLIELNEGFIIYENRDTLDFEIYRIFPSQNIINAIKSKAKDLFSHSLSGTLPDRPYKTNSAKECQVCEFMKTCWV